VRQEIAARYGLAVWPHLLRRRRLAGLTLTAIRGFLLACFVYANFSQDSSSLLIAGIVTIGASVLAAGTVRRETELALQAMEQAMGGPTPDRVEHAVAGG
jgi:hypothetical protein